MTALSICLYLMVSNLVGLRPALAVNMGIVGMVTLALAGMAAPERKARLARDVERGFIECAIRHPNALPGSLSGFWQPCIADVNGILSARAHPAPQVLGVSP